jgi:hypothetical protein
LAFFAPLREIFFASLTLFSRQVANQTPRRKYLPNRRRM